MSSVSRRKRGVDLRFILIKIIIWLIIMIILALFSFPYDNNKNKISPEPLVIEDPTKTNMMDVSAETNKLELVSTVYAASENPDRVDMNEESEEPVDIVEMNKPPVYNYEYTGYINTKSLRVRSLPSTDGEEIGYLVWNDQVNYSIYNDDWVVINYENRVSYISKQYISDTRLEYNEKGVEGDMRKSYMDYTCITDTTSAQWVLQHNYAYTESNGVRAVNGRYCIALGSYYTHMVGQYVDLILENGIVIPCIIGDQKKDEDTINGCRLGVDGGVAEFVVETSALNSKVTQTGDVSYSSNEWLSNVVLIRVYDTNIFN